MQPSGRPRSAAAAFRTSPQGGGGGGDGSAGHASQTWNRTFEEIRAASSLDSAFEKVRGASPFSVASLRRRARMPCGPRNRLPRLRLRPALTPCSQHASDGAAPARRPRAT